MRERAEKATRGPWEFEGDDPTDDEVFDVPDCRPVAFTRGRNVANGQHIASWHPGVALSVAAWLEHEASRPIGTPWPGTVKRAVAVARAYLGETETEGAGR